MFLNSLRARFNFGNLFVGIENDGRSRWLWSCYGVTRCGLYFNRMVTELFELVWSRPSAKFSIHLTVLLHFYNLQPFAFLPRKSTFWKSERSCRGCLFVFSLAKKILPRDHALVILCDATRWEHATSLWNSKQHFTNGFLIHFLEAWEFAVVSFLVLRSEPRYNVRKHFPKHIWDRIEKSFSNLFIPSFHTLPLWIMPIWQRYMIHVLNLQACQYLGEILIFPKWFFAFSLSINFSRKFI